jgi:cysteine desulfurase
MRAYFDYNASSVPLPEAREAVSRALEAGHGNPSSMHSEGRTARAIIERSRDQLSSLLGVSSRRIVFTSGATESNNTALRGFAGTRADATIITTQIEHHSVLATAEVLESRGTRVVRVPVDVDGQPDLDTIERETRERRCLVSIGLANGETGHVLALHDLRKVIAPETVLHVDAAQAVGRLPLDLTGVDLLSLSAHKFGGPKGVGALVAPETLMWPSLLTGGPQERTLRAGTENVAGIAGMGAAAEIWSQRLAVERARLASLRDDLWRVLSAAVGNMIRLTPTDGLPNTLTVALADVTSDVMVAGLDLAGYAVSAGSACAAGAIEPSHVVRALRVGEVYRGGVVRISLGHATTEEEVTGLASAFIAVAARARKAA